MSTVGLKYVVDQLRERDGVVFEPGLSDHEVQATEERFGFRFPPDLRFVLQYALPVSRGFVDWRRASETVIRSRLSWPLEGILFDVEHNGFWMDGWGDRPSGLAEALGVARQEVLKAPVLIPIYSHRYLPEEPCLSGNPVFSVYQTDVIHYGRDLYWYFLTEFHTSFPGELLLSAGQLTPEQLRPIRFWDDLVHQNSL